MRDFGRLYLSGPMTGIPEHNFPAFNRATAELRALGIDVVNPVEVNPDATKSWSQCLREDIKALCDCQGIVLMPGWAQSNGAQLELHVAHRLGMNVHFLQDIFDECR
jgi:hypothetical protein